MCRATRWCAAAPSTPQRALELFEVARAGVLVYIVDVPFHCAWLVVPAVVAEQTRRAPHVCIHLTRVHNTRAVRGALAIVPRQARLVSLAAQLAPPEVAAT